ncbi:peptidase M24, structural domain-containing protein [Umbelopsis sp. AD052]|nr:peptidase M24, structural domain-containing protein [Umbelopsis sp. AD052]
MELTLQYPQAKFEADNDLADANVISKYKIAANIANATLAMVLEKIAPGVSTFAICRYGDELIQAYTSKMFKEAEKGVAVPTCVTVNNLVQYYTPLASEAYTLKAGDVVKVELGAHIDGYIGTAAHTTVVTVDPSQPITGKAADVIAAAYYAQEAVLRMMKPGTSSTDISRVIAETAAYFRCNPVQDTFSAQMKRFVLRASKEVDNRIDPEMPAHELEKREFTLEHNEVYSLNIVLTTGQGRVKDSEHKAMVYQRNVNKSHALKMKASRQAYSEINAKHTVFPFAMSALANNQARLGLPALLTHGLVTPLFTTRSAMTSDIVAQFKLTVLITATGAIRTTMPQTLPYVHSEFSVPAGTDTATLLQSSDIKNPKAPSGLPSVDVVFGAPVPEEQDVEMEL